MNGRIVVMIAGGVILASAFVKSHPDMIANPPESTREACSALVDPGYRNLQISQFIAGSEGATANIVNAGKVAYRGVEAEITAVPVRGLTLDGSIGYTDPKYKTYLYLDPATDTVINVASEARMSQAAKFNAHVGAQYEQDIGLGTLSLRADYSYRSTVYWFTLDRVSQFNRDIRSRPDHNLRARIALDDIAIGRAKLGLGVWGDNLTDQRNIDIGIDFGSLG